MGLQQLAPDVAAPALKSGRGIGPAPRWSSLLPFRDVILNFLARTQGWRKVQSSLQGGT